MPPRPWPREVRAVGAKLLHDYGPFLVRSWTGPRRPRYPLVDLDGVLDAMLRSDVMAERVPTADAAYDYVMQCSRRLAASASPAQRVSAEVKARRHGIAEPLFLALGAKDGHGWAQHRPSKPIRSRRSSVPGAVRFALWNRWHGCESGTGSCFCCGCKVTQQDFEAGHVVAASRGGGCSVDNLRVLCRACNRSMGSRNLLDFRAEHFGSAMDVD